MWQNSNQMFRVCAAIAMLLGPVQLKASWVEVEPQVKIYYETVGNGSPLLFIPGWMMTVGVWKEQSAEFSKTHQVIAIDPRSQGNSSKVLTSNSLQQHARDLHRVMELLRLDRVTLVGWSMAVATILEYANQFGTDRLKAVVLVDGTPSMVKKDDWPHGLTQQEIYEFISDWENDRVAKTNEFVDGMFKTEQTAWELEWIVKEAMRTPTTISTVLAFDYFSRDRRPFLARLSVPTLILMASDNKDLGELIQALIPKSELTTFDGLGHAMFLEDPKRFNERLAAFLASVE